MLRVNLVVTSVVETQNDVALNAVGVIDEQVGNGRAVGNKQPTDALRRDLILAVLVGAGRGRIRRG